MIDKYGPEIAKGLKIASTQVYDKVVWYIRIDGVVGLVTTILLSSIAIILGVLAHKFNVKNKLYMDDYGPNPALIGSYLLALVIFLMVTMMVTTGLLPNIAKIISPEYWIINQIVNKVNN